MPSTANVVYISPAFTNQKIHAPKRRPPTAHSSMVVARPARCRAKTIEAMTVARTMPMLAVMVTVRPSLIVIGSATVARIFSATSIAVAEGQSYPPALDPNKVTLTDKIKKLPAFDPTGTMTSLTFADPIYWADNEDAWTKQWDRISKGA